MVEIIIPVGVCAFFWFLFLDWGFFVLEKSGLIFCKIPEVFLLLGRKAILLILVVGRGVFFGLFGYGF
ncbi:hypothetical protein BSPWISOX_1881 [uncultured Gammaproteobacteria bacterium]|nr:hypothetical protein BSPWISOX_1881 [uncultured Gammaproteobacteria bacterium]VVM25709.1 hypothetical protein BSPWISOXPB_7745 [uncultured Gammaproteobacteria bacterium]